MPAALLAIFLLSATVDPRLAEPLRLLAEVRDLDGRLVGSFYARVPDALALTLAVHRLPDGEDARYDRDRRTLTVAEALCWPRTAAGGRRARLPGGRGARI